MADDVFEKEVKSLIDGLNKDEKKKVDTYTDAVTKAWNVGLEKGVLPSDMRRIADRGYDPDRASLLSKNLPEEYRKALNAAEAARWHVLELMKEKLEEPAFKKRIDEQVAVEMKAWEEGKPGLIERIWLPLDKEALESKQDEQRKVAVGIARRHFAGKYAGAVLNIFDAKSSADAKRKIIEMKEAGKKAAGDGYKGILELGIARNFYMGPRFEVPDGIQLSRNDIWKIQDIDMAPLEKKINETLKKVPGYDKFTPEQQKQLRDAFNMQLQGDVNAAVDKGGAEVEKIKDQVVSRLRKAGAGPTGLSIRVDLLDDYGAARRLLAQSERKSGEEEAGLKQKAEDSMLALYKKFNERFPQLNAEDRQKNFLKMAEYFREEYDDRVKEYKKDDPVILLEQSPFKNVPEKKVPQPEKPKQEDDVGFTIPSEVARQARAAMKDTSKLDIPLFAADRSKDKHLGF